MWACQIDHHHVLEDAKVQQVSLFDITAAPVSCAGLTRSTIVVGEHDKECQTHFTSMAASVQLFGIVQGYYNKLSATQGVLPTSRD